MPSPRSTSKKPTRRTKAPAVNMLLASMEEVTADGAKGLARLNLLETGFRTARASETDALFDEAFNLGPILGEKLYLLRACKTFEEYCAKQLVLDKREGLLLAQIGRSFTAAQFKQLKLERARLGLLLLSATPEKDTVTELFTAKLRYGSGKGKLFVDATLLEIREDVRGERGKEAAPGKPTEAAPAMVAWGKKLGQACGVTVDVYVDPSVPDLFFDVRRISFGAALLVLPKLARVAASLIKGMARPKPS